MRKLFIVSTALLVAVIANAQVEVKKAEFPNYQGVITVEGQSAAQLYSKIKLWVAENFKSANDVIQSDDKDAGIMVMKGNFVCTCPGFVKWPARCDMTLKTEVKDNRFRYTITITDVRDDSTPSNVSVMNSILANPSKKNMAGTISAISQKVESITNEMYKSAETTQEDDDW